MTIVPPSLRSIIVTCAHSRNWLTSFSVLFRAPLNENRGKEREKRLTSQTRCADERKFVWFAGKIENLREERNETLRDTQINTNGEEDEKPRVRDSVGSAVETDVVVESCRGRDVISHPLLGVTIAFVIPVKKEEEKRIEDWIFNLIRIL